MNFSFLPAEAKFYTHFERASENLLEGARTLEELLENYVDVERKAGRIKDIEHQGDLIVHEVTNLLPRTLITPIDGEDIQRLVNVLDDALDAIDAAAERLLIYQVSEVREPACALARLISQSALELDAAIKSLSNKKLYAQVHKHIVQINTLENESDQVLRQALSALVEQRDDIFDFIRWKEIYELLEATVDEIENAGDVIQKVMIANA